MKGGGSVGFGLNYRGYVGIKYSLGFRVCSLGLGVRVQGLGPVVYHRSFQCKVYILMQQFLKSMNNQQQS